VDTRIYVDGRISEAREARIPVLDHGFLFGDSVYEVLWWHWGTLIQQEDHLERLERSAARLYMELQVSRSQLVAAMQETVRATGAQKSDDAYVRLILTRGAGPLGLDFSGVPHRGVVIIVAPARRPSDPDFDRGLRVAFINRRRTSVRALDPSAKTGNYLNNLLALHEARLAGADDAIMLNERGQIAEATTANVYALQAGILYTPPLAAGILKGTTRTRILALCARTGVEVREVPLSPDEVRGAEEVFLSSSVRGILPVVSIDEVSVGDGCAGAFTRRMREVFEAAADAEARAARSTPSGQGG